MFCSDTHQLPSSGKKKSDKTKKIPFQNKAQKKAAGNKTSARDHQSSIRQTTMSSTSNAPSMITSPTTATNTSTTLLELLDTYASQGTTWEQLPPNIRESVSNNADIYIQCVKKYCIEHQISFEKQAATTPLQSFMSKRDYYSEMVQYLKSNLYLYPYHFSHVVVNELGILPFHYYSDMLTQIMKSEKSYDILPNFTAADVNRLMGIGRNQYIDIMNKVRSKRWIWKFNKNIVRDMLPSNPIASMTMDYWWIVEPYPMTQNEFAKWASGVERAALASAASNASNVNSPTSVSNVSSPSNTSGAASEENDAKLLISTLATVRREGKILACKLPYRSLLHLYRRGLIHFTVPVNSDDYIVVPPLKNFIMNRTPNDHFEKLLYDILVILDERRTVRELAETLGADEDLVKTAVSICCRLGFAKKKLVKPQNLDERSEDQYHNSWQKRIDAYYEEMKVGGVTGTGNSAMSSSTGTQNQQGSGSSEASVASFDRTGKHKRIGFLFDSSLTAYLMMGNLAEGLKNHAVTLFEVGKMPDESMNEFLFELDQIKSSGEGEGEAQRYYEHAIALRSTLRFLRHNDQLGLNSAPELDCDGGVDMIRAESLDNLDSGTKMRIIEQNYAVLIAMAPIAPGSLILPTCIPRYYGPPIPQVSTFWFKLYTYVCCQYGPPSILFRKGQRVRRLPKLLQSDCKVTLAGWEQEPNQINARILLQVLNESLISSPNILQVFGAYDETQMFEVPFPFSPEVLDSAPPASSSAVNHDVDESDLLRTADSANDPFSLGNEEDDMLIDLDDNNNNNNSSSSSSGGVQQDSIRSRPVSHRFTGSALKEDVEVNVFEMLGDEEKQQIAEVMDRLTNKLHLQSSFGCVKMLRSKHHNDPTKSIIYPMDIHFGIPLSNSRINSQVCDIIVKQDMLSAQKIHEHSANMQTMCSEFLQFIAENVEVSVEQLSHEIYPKHNVYFDGHGLSPYSNVCK